MSNDTSKKDKVFSPSRTVWRTQMAKGLYTPHRASRITCIINNLLSDKVGEFLGELGVTSYVENGRVVREYIKPRPLGLPGEIINLQSSGVDVYRFTVPRERSKEVLEAIIGVAGLEVPGRGTVFSQDLMEFTKEPPEVNNEVLKRYASAGEDVQLLKKLSYVNCVLSTPGSGDHLARIALDLGVCVPLITFGSGNDVRDQLGLIRITISAEKEKIGRAHV